MPRIATSARARTGLQDRAREYRSTAMSNHRDRKDLPAEDDRNRPPETPEHRKHRKQHERDTQDEALDETFPASSSDERRVGNECASTGNSRWTKDHNTHKPNNTNRNK